MRDRSDNSILAGTKKGCVDEAMDDPGRGKPHFSELGHRMEPPVITELMAQALENPNLLSLAAGFTDNAILPGEKIRETVERLSKGDPEYLQYGTNQGRPGLREAAARWCARYPGEDPEAYEADSFLITNGSQQCLYLAMQVLCDPGDLVLVERPSYFVFLEMLKGLGIRAVGLPTLTDGTLDAEGLDRLLGTLSNSGEIERLRAVYLVSYHSNPAARSLSEEEKNEVADALLRHERRIPVVEDAAYRDLFFEEPHPARTTLSLWAFASFPKLFLGTFTKPLATGMKIGFGICTDREWLQRMLGAKGHQDFGSSNFCQAIVEDLLVRGLYDPLLDIQRAHYRDKASRMVTALESSGLREAGWDWAEPTGGLLVWMRGPEGLDTSIGSSFCETCIAEGVLYVPGDLSFTGGEPKNYVRLSFGAIAEDRMAEACLRFGRVGIAFSRSFSVAGKG